MTVPPDTADYTVSPTGTVGFGNTVTVTFTAKQGVQLNGQTVFTHTFRAQPEGCTRSATPVAPTFTEGDCTTAPSMTVPPETDDYTVSVTGTAGFGNTVTVTFTATAGRPADRADRLHAHVPGAAGGLHDDHDARQDAVVPGARADLHRRHAVHPLDVVRHRAHAGPEHGDDHDHRRQRQRRRHAHQPAVQRPDAVAGGVARPGGLAGLGEDRRGLVHATRPTPCSARASTSVPMSTRRPARSSSPTRRPPRPAPSRRRSSPTRRPPPRR